VVVSGFWSARGNVGFDRSVSVGRRPSPDIFAALSTATISARLPGSGHYSSAVELALGKSAARILSTDTDAFVHALVISILSVYTHIAMPNKTIYVKDTDLPLLEQAQQQLGDSVSSMFAEFLRERVAKLTPEENSVIELINQIVATRETLKKERSLPEFIDSENAESQAYAEKALKSFRAGEIRKTKALFWAANAYYERAQRDAKEVRELTSKIAGLLGPHDKHAGPRK
jgi:hypothetical protein